jgi:hypothetical protein
MSITWGKPGREVKHQWGTLVLNDRQPAGGAGRYVIDKLTGWYSLPEIEDARRSSGSKRGEVVLPTYPRGKTVVYEERIEAKTLPAWRSAYRALASAFQFRNEEGYMYLLGSPVEWFFRARVMQMDADDDPANIDPRRPWPLTGGFQIGLRLGDARTYALPLVQHNVAGGGASTVTNLGTSDTDPTFAIHVATAGDVTLTNAAVGRGLTFRGLPTGDYTLVFGPGDRQMVNAAGTDFSGHLDVDSSAWWDELIPGLVSGDNPITVTGASAWRCDFYYADA